MYRPVHSLNDLTTCHLNEPWVPSPHQFHPFHNGGYWVVHTGTALVITHYSLSLHVKVTQMKSTPEHLSPTLLWLQMAFRTALVQSSPEPLS